MEYEPIKRSLGRFLSEKLFLRKLFYCLLDLLLLRSWHVRRSLKTISRSYPGEASVLDAGAGFGQYTWRMSRMNRKWKIRAVDISDEYVEESKKFFESAGLSERIVCEKADLTALNDTGKYDLILCVDVIEHIEDDRGVFSNFFRALTDGGRLLISTPSDPGSHHSHEISGSSIVDEHVRDGYSRQDITDKLKDAGFSNIIISYTYGIPGKLSWKLSMKYPLKMLNISGIFFVILPFYYIIIFPFAFILNTFDLCLKHKKGTGLLVQAQK